MEIKIGSLVKFYTVLFISEGPKHGYELMKGLENKVGKISSSQVYPFLNILERNKIIKIDKVFVKQHIERFGDLLHIAIAPKLTTCAHCGCKVYSGGVKQKVDKKELMFCCHYCAKACHGDYKKK